MEHRRIFTNYLQERGLRLTKVRELILEAVFATHSHFDAEELYDSLKGQAVSRATVYRTMPLLVDSGLVKKSMFGLDKEKYEHIYGHPNHFHIICKKCGRVIEQIDKNLEMSIMEITDRNGFTYEDYHLKISGICSLCKE